MVAAEHNLFECICFLCCWVITKKGGHHHFGKVLCTPKQHSFSWFFHQAAQNISLCNIILIWEKHLTNLRAENAWVGGILYTTDAWQHYFGHSFVTEVFELVLEDVLNILRFFYYSPCIVLEFFFSFFIVFPTFPHVFLCLCQYAVHVFTQQYVVYL